MVTGKIDPGRLFGRSDRVAHFCRGICATTSADDTNLFPANLLGRRSDLACWGHDAEMFELFARLQCRCKPARFQPASGPCFRGILRIAVFRSDCASWTASTSACPHSTCRETLQVTELTLESSAFLNDFSAESCFDLVSEL